ncbi:MAG: HigA family addiction module antitoxin [Sedimenticola sp.]
MKMSRMHKPPHPGSILREDVIPAMEITVTEAAKQLGVTRVALSRVINERAGISPEMALKIEDWLGIEQGGRAELWTGMQLDYDMWHARQNHKAA